MEDQDMDGGFLERSQDLKFNLEAFRADLNDDESEDDDRDELKAGYFAYLSDIASIVEEADKTKADDMERIVEIADDIFSSAVDFMDPYNDSRYGRFGSMKSFAHNESQRPVLNESDGKKPEYTSHHFYYGVALPMIEFFGNTDFFDAARADEALGSLQFPPSWRTTMRPDPSSTQCARFSDNCPDDVITDQLEEDTPIAASVAKARCQITATPLTQPYNFSLSMNQKGFTTSAGGGWKNRDPYLRCESLSDPTLRCTFKVPLADLTETCFDTDNSIIVAGDWERIKTYRLHPLEEGATKRKLLPLHTMASQEYTGPMSLLSANRLARCGKGKLAVWYLDELPTHGENGRQTIGDIIPEEELNTWRTAEDVERSSGSPPHDVLSIPWADQVIHKWHPHPSVPGTMLCSLKRESEQFKCHAIDLASGGVQPKARYLGHGGQIESFSTSKGNANLFVTSADDCYVRVFDQRHPLPVLTIREGAYSAEALPCAALCHPDGLPYLFTSNDKEEAIKLLDMRSNAPVYELATGNNAVIGMAWDDEATTLSAITECCHEGNEYRAAKFSPRQLARQKAQAGALAEAMDEDDDDDGEDEDPYEDYQEDTTHSRKWPKKAYHAENYWGHVFDSRRRHNIYRYKFMSNPDLNVRPGW